MVNDLLASFILLDTPGTEEAEDIGAGGIIIPDDDEAADEAELGGTDGELLAPWGGRGIEDGLGMEDDLGGGCWFDGGIRGGFDR